MFSHRRSVDWVVGADGSTECRGAVVVRYAHPIGAAAEPARAEALRQVVSMVPPVEAGFRRAEQAFDDNPTAHGITVTWRDVEFPRNVPPPNAPPEAAPCPK